MALDKQTLKQLTACLSYGTVSVSMTLFNKAVFSIYQFNFPSFVTTLQIIVSIVYMLVLEYFKYLEIESISVKTATLVFPLTMFWWLYVVSGVTALRYLTVPMFSCFRRSTTLLVVLGEWLLLSKKPTPQGFFSILVMVTGAVIAGATDLTFNLPGYIWVAICAVSTAVYLLLIRLLKDKTGLSQSALLFYNNVLALPVMTSFMLTTTDEIRDVAHYPQIHESSFQLFLLLSASQAFLLNLCIFWCTTINSPLATTVTGQMKDILTTGLGMFIFGDVEFEPKNVIGVGIGLTGGIMYAYFSYRDAQKKAPAYAAVPSAPPAGEQAVSLPTARSGGRTPEEQLSGGQDRSRLRKLHAAGAP
ncbi:hypothetical protein CVIRNUC_003036 [Coccomyxa viridis]|uniref:Sugar phosphate transporter domain-containing protein n=1 Tax=Coccomyxa viridis TaxID=1274662 RepID=A0AAV1HZ34_9CHLO|nr:hypothetical protein CVIRNUC_003036 [Coccomyxa viridis]